MSLVFKIANWFRDLFDCFQSGGSVECDSLSRLLHDAEVLLDKPEDDTPSRMTRNLKEFEEIIQLLPTASDLTNAPPGNKFKKLKCQIMNNCTNYCRGFR